MAVALTLPGATAAGGTSPPVVRPPERLPVEVDRATWPAASGYTQEGTTEPEVGCFQDHVGDVVDGETGEARPDPRADLLGHCALYYDGVIVVGSVVDEPTDPLLDRTWTEDATLAYWEIDVDGDAQVDYFLAYYPVDGQLRAFLTLADGSHVCPGEAAGVYDDGLYIAAVPGHCLSSPEVISVAAVMVYDDRRGSGYLLADSAPTGAGFDGPVVHQRPPEQPSTPEVGSAPPPPPTEEPPAEAPPGPEPPTDTEPDPAPFDGDPATTERIVEADPTAAAIAISRLRFVTGAPYVVLSRDDIFADSLAGSSLTRRAPMLFTDPAVLDPTTLAEIQRVAEPGARVYILGGVNAVAAAVEDDLRAEGYEPTRLAGPTRVETALAIADELPVVNDDAGDAAMLARAYGLEGEETAAWADAISAGGVAAERAVPILLTPTGGLHGAVAAWLDANPRADTVLLGGTAALSEAVAEALPQARRVAGAERTATAVEIARSLWEIDATNEAPRYVLTSAYRQDGWAFGLAAAGLSADHSAPVLLAGEALSPATAELLTSCDTPQIEVVIVGDASIVAEAVLTQIDTLDGGPC